MKRKSLSILATLVAVFVNAAAPNGSGTYYQNANGKKGSVLKTALCGIIYNRTEQTYSSLWTAFYTTDVRAGGENKLWDMYSSHTPYLTLGTNQDTGSGNAEGQYYNREHSFPQSWFGGENKAPMYTDLHHIYPTDKFVNGKRANYPFGETDGNTYKSENNFSKLGACTISGYSGTVFEPNDEYKGDFARTYFYMVTCYEEKLADWVTNYGGDTDVDEVLDGNTYPGLTTWQLNMLLKWAKNDPVSQKEIDRNTAVKNIQGNRNPFIDYPGLEQYIWGSKVDDTFSYDNYVVPPGHEAQSGSGSGTGTYKLQQVTSVESGGLYVFEQSGHVMINSVSSSALQTTSTYNTTGLTGTETYVWTLETATGGYYMKNVSLTNYPYFNNTSSTTVAFEKSKSSIWAFNFQTDGTVLIQNTSSSNRFLGYTTSNSYAYKAYATSNLSSYPHAIKVYQLVEETPSPASSDLALTGAPVVLSFDLYNNSSAQTVSYTTSGTGAVTVSGGEGYVTTSVNASDKTITVTPTAVTPSAQTITVSQAADATHDAGSVTFTVSVNDSSPIEGSVFVRVNDLKYLVDGAKVVIAARFNTSQTNGYYAMPTTTSGKPEGVIFGSSSLSTEEILPEKILNNISDYCWTMGVTVTNNTKSYTFTNANSQKLGYSGTGTDFTSISNTEWKITRETAGDNALVGGYKGFYIINQNNSGRGVALNSNYAYGAYSTSNNNGSGYNFYVDIFVKVESVTVSDAGYATYCGSNALDFTDSGIEAYIGTIQGEKLTFTPLYQVPANTGLLLVASGGATEKIPVIASADALACNCLTGVNVDTTIDSEDYILNVVGGKAGFYKAGTYTSLAAHRAYISKNKGAGVKSFVFGDNLDAIKDISDLKDSKDFDGVDGFIHNLAGQRLNKMQKGINIINGKKVLK